MNPIGAVMGALKYMPATLARQALEKVNPKFKNYFSSALTYGIDANRALDFLTERFESDAQREHRSQLDKGAANNTLRPDEMVSRSQMANADLPGKAIKAGASLAAGGLLGLPSSEKASAVSSEKQPQAPASLISKYSPELDQYLSERIQTGESVMSAVNGAVKEPKFTQAIHKMQRELQKTFPHIVSDVYGGNASPPQQQQQKPQQASPSAGKQQFLQSMQQLSQTIQQMRGKR